MDPSQIREALQRAREQLAETKAELETAVAALRRPRPVNEEPDYDIREGLARIEQMLITLLDRVRTGL